MKEKLETKRGISLIVLVITIIVIIILAAAVILTVSNNNPVERANKAVADNDEQVLREAAALEYSDLVLEYNGKLPPNATKLIQQRLNEKGLDGSRVTITEKGGLEIGDISTDLSGYVDGVKIPAGFVASEVVGENTKAGGLVIYEGEEPVTAENVEVARTTRNQFVWVPVEDMSKFKRTTTYNGTITNPDSGYEEPYSSGSQAEKDEYAKMYASVEKNKGFYIARYEAGTERPTDPDTGMSLDEVTVSKKEAMVLDSPWGTSMTDFPDFSYGAVECAQKMALANKTEVVSTLIYGVQWDAALQFIAKTDAEYIANSTGKGWYTDNDTSSFQGNNAGTDIGNNASNKICNIYDMAGNFAEWTMEAYGSDYRVLRGGDITNSGSDMSSSYRSSSDSIIDGLAGGFRSFRVALYLK